MRVLEPKELERRRQDRNRSLRRRHFRLPVKSLVVLVAAVYTGISLLMPLPVLEAHTNKVVLEEAEAAILPWPVYGQAAIGAAGYGLLAQNGEQKAAPIASMAKVVTALAVLKVKPMKPNTFGETLTITGPDVETYFAYASQGQSVIRVEAGEELTQYQALQALLLPSANNMADVMVRWAFGSTEDYVAFVNPFVTTLGLTHTHIADASGFSPQTVSTAVDLVKLAEIAMNHPLIAEIVAQPRAELPVAGTVRNVNFQLGSNGIIGIKTGNTDQAGGCYLFAARRTIQGGEVVTVIGAIMGAPVLSRAINDSLPLLDATFQQFSTSVPVAAGTTVGSLRREGGGTSAIITKGDVLVTGWKGKPTQVNISLRDVPSDIAADEVVGSLTFAVGEKTYQVPLVAEKTISKHNYWWRLLHIGGLV